MIVALIDSGIDLYQPALVSHVWTNPSEKPDGIDNDGNGLIDDIYGWDFVRNSTDLQDRAGHGTQMANLMVKSNPHIKLMVLRVFDYKTINSSRIAKAIDYATNNGAQIINLSLTSSNSNAEIVSAIQRALSKGIKVVAAAGNEGTERPSFPASVPGVLSVVAVDDNGNIKKWSNGDKGKVNENVKVNIDNLSTYTLGGQLKPASGTSSAAAVYSGRLSIQF